MPITRRPAGTLAALLAASLLACSGSSAAGPGTSPTGVTVTVAPGAVRLLPGATVAFSASVAGSANAAVAWSVAEASGGTVDATGRYVAPLAEGTYHVIARSVADPGAEGVASVTVSATTSPGNLALFTAPNAWNTPVDGAPLHPSSSAMIAWLTSAGGFGGGHVQVDFSMKVLEATTSTPFLEFTPGPSFYTPDCDRFPFPVPAGGSIEGESGYACTSGGDCHLLVVDRANAKLYEMYQADLSGSTFVGGCAVTWDLATSYPAELRGDQCTSTDAAGLPVAALLFTADELAAGSIDHAIRFILPNARMRAGAYVRPATHAGAPSGPAEAPPFGSRLRLRADYPVDSLASSGARVVARALQRYGMILADGGTIALTAADDTLTAHKWSETSFDSHSLTSLQPSDFEVVDTGPVIPLTYDCVRNGL